MMESERAKWLLDRLSEVSSTDDLLDFELRNGPFDEDDPDAARVLFQVAAVRCHLSRGPAPTPDAFRLSRPAPLRARAIFEVRGRLGTRIVRVGWADGVLFGSLYAIARLRCDAEVLSDAARARDRIIAQLDVVLEGPALRSVA